MYPASAQQPQVARGPRLRQDPGYGVAASAAIALATVANVVTNVADWRTASVVERYVDAQTSTADLEAADRFTLLTNAIYLGTLLIAAVLFIIWLRRARENAEFLCDARHQYGRGWVIGAWFVPIGSFWIPRQVVNDIAVASDPWTSTRGVWLKTQRSPEVSSWWIFWILQAVTGWLAAVLTNGAVSKTGSAVVPGLKAAAALASLSSVLCCVAAVLAIRVITTINGDQAARPPIPWWANPENRP